MIEFLVSFQSDFFVSKSFGMFIKNPEKSFTK